MVCSEVGFVIRDKLGFSKETSVGDALKRGHIVYTVYVLTLISCYLEVFGRKYGVEVFVRALIKNAIYVNCVVVRNIRAVYKSVTVFVNVGVYGMRIKCVLTVKRGLGYHISSDEIYLVTIADRLTGFYIVHFQVVYCDVGELTFIAKVPVLVGVSYNAYRFEVTERRIWMRGFLSVAVEIKAVNVNSSIPD